MMVVDLKAAPTVLIAEADPWTRDLIKQVVLTVRCDAQLDVCGDGQQALAQLGKKTYGLVIADRDLPGVGGLDLLRTVRQRRAVPAQPFILLSERNDSASVREALPLAPTHDDCSVPVARENGDDGSPFAVLRGLKIPGRRET